MEPAENTVENSIGGVRDIFGPNFLDEAVCRQWVLRNIHRDGAFCPRCRAAVSAGKAGKFWSGRRITCGRCGKDFSARTGTLLACTSIGFRELVFLGWMLGEGYSDLVISARMSLNRETVRLWRKKLDRIS